MFLKKSPPSISFAAFTDELRWPWLFAYPDECDTDDAKTRLHHRGGAEDHRGQPEEMADLLGSNFELLRVPKFGHQGCT